MGKLHSKQVRCVLEPGLDKDFGKYNITCQSVEELLMSCYENNKDLALNVEMPPEKCLADNKTINLLTLDKEMTNSEATTDNNKSQNKLNFEELECGICVECSENSKQEWMFTLYDFDGQGKVTKEDLATLLKALYDAVGSSLKLPSNSMKSLKLRLSVGSDDNTEIKSDGKVPSAMTQSVSKPARHPATARKFESKFPKINNLTETAKVPKSNIEKQEQEMGEEKGCNVEHQHLAELVQENMMRNKVEHDRPHTKKKHASRRRIKTNSFTYRQLKENWGDGAARESQARRNYYLDLAGIENSCLHQPIAEADPGNQREMCRNILRDSEGASLQRTCGNGCRYSLITHNRNRPNVNSEQTDSKGAWKHCCVADDGKIGVKNCCQVETPKNCGKTIWEADDAKSSRKILVNADISDKDCVGMEYGGGKMCQNSDNLQNVCVINGKIGINGKSLANVKLSNVAEYGLLENGGDVSPKRSHHKVPDGGVADMSSPKTKVRNSRSMSIASNVATNGSANHHKRHKQRDADNSLAMKQVAEWIEKEYPQDQRCLKRHEHHHIHHHHHYYHHYHVT